MLKGFKEFLSRGNVIDLAVAVVIGAAFTALVTSVTDKVVKPLVSRIGAGDQNYGFLSIKIGPGEADVIDLNAVLSAMINFVIVAAVLYFVIVLPYKKLRERGEVEQAQDTELSLLTEIRDLLAAQSGTEAVTAGPGTGPSPDTATFTSADRSDKDAEKD